MATRSPSVRVEENRVYELDRGIRVDRLSPAATKRLKHAHFLGFNLRTDVPTLLLPCAELLAAL